MPLPFLFFGAVFAPRSMCMDVGCGVVLRGTVLFPLQLHTFGTMVPKKKRRKHHARDTVKWFSNEKGFCFITPDKSKPAQFVQGSALRGNGVRTLTESQPRGCDEGQGPKGPQATSVRPA